MREMSELGFTGFKDAQEAHPGNPSILKIPVQTMQRETA